MVTLLHDLKQEKRFLVILFFVSLALRMLLFVAFTRHDSHAFVYFDSDQYQSLALRLACGHGITNDDGSAQCYRLPGYSCFLAACYTMFGDDYQYALWLQLIVASIIPILIFMLMRLLFPLSLAVAKIAASMSALHLGFIIYAGMVATETLFVFFFLLFLLCFIPLLRFRWSDDVLQKPWPLCAGLLLGIASLIRPVGHYMLCMAVLFVLLTHTPWRHKVKQGMRLIVGWVIVVGPWLIRNFLVCGALFFHTLPGLHFLQYIAANVVAQHEGSNYAQVRIRLIDEWNTKIKVREQDQQKALTEYDRCVIGERLAMSYALRYPLQTCRYCMAQLIKTGCALYSAQLLIADTNAWPDYGKHATWWDRVKRFIAPDVNHGFIIPLVYYEIVFCIVMMVGIAFAFWRRWRWRALWNALFMLTPWIIVLWGVTLAYGCARLRMPFEPLLIMWSAYGWSALRNE